MLTLYVFSPMANSMKPLLTLYEKGVAFEARRLEPSKFEHHEDWFKAINPRGQVPALDHDGKIITESTVICEYIEDVFADNGTRLRPDDPYERAEMRIWTKWVDEYFCWCVSTIGWQRMVGHMARQLTDAQFEAQVLKIPVPEQRTKWRNARDGFPQAVLDEEMRKIGVSVKKLEARLRDHEWLIDWGYSLADICNFAIANGMQNGFPELVNETDTPGLVAWIKRINQRPAAKAMFAAVPREKMMQDRAPQSV
jgi:glutathione S-transferase